MSSIKKNINKFNEFDIIQNHVLGAHALWEFVKNFESYHPQNKGVLLTLTLPVLPIVFNQEASTIIKSRNFKEGSLIKVLAENGAFNIGFQERMEAMTEQTLKSLHLAFSLDLLLIDNNDFTLYSKETGNINFGSAKNYKDYYSILSASRRLGAWFAQLTYDEILMYFNISF